MESMPEVPQVPDLELPQRGQVVMAPIEILHPLKARWVVSDIPHWEFFVELETREQRWIRLNAQNEWELAPFTSADIIPPRLD